ncbi:MAG TPA: suppressor of fused domain protein [Acidobacteriaceae bacterium]|nr:suppressor of fused domain protein [Acidobacteriaceae bacterium]
MGSWFNKKRAPDGTNIIQHGNVETRLGVTEGSTGFARERETVYERLFGKPLIVSHELLPLIPHIDVYTFKRSQGEKEVYSLVTGGMSDLEMTLPRGADKDAPRRVELIFYCTEPRDEYISTLRWVAHFPHASKSWLGHGHTMPNGNPPAPFWGTTDLDTLFFLPPIVRKDQTLPSELSLDGEPVHFLWVVPLTTAECNFKLTNGFNAMLDLFQQNRHPHVFDPHRTSYV